MKWTLSACKCCNKKKQAIILNHYSGGEQCKKMKAESLLWNKFIFSTSDLLNGTSTRARIRLERATRSLPEEKCAYSCVKIKLYSITFTQALWTKPTNAQLTICANYCVIIVYYRMACQDKCVIWTQMFLWIITVTWKHIKANLI